MNRSAMLQRLRESASQVWDIAVIGGGATGLGAAWNASSRGYRTLLVEAVDFANGTSSRSTKLIHGGVRYLRQGQIRMVRDSLHERQRLLDSASPLVHPLQFVIPTYHLGSRWYYFGGMKAYDFLAGKLNVAPARLLSASQVSELQPNLQANGLRGGVLYSDAQFDDARLAVSLAQTIANYANACVANYLQVVGLETNSQANRVVLMKDKITGEEFSVQSRVVVNATGVFAGKITELERSTSTSRVPQLQIAPSRGTHIVLPQRFLNSSFATMIPETDDGRVLFAIPWLGHTLVGTTDVPTHKIELDPRPELAEVDYLLDHVGRYLTTKPLRSDVLAIFAGLRPLIGHQGTSNTSQLSREHEIHVSQQGLITIVGGKWTTFRKMGEDVINLACEQASLVKRPSQPQTLLYLSPSSAQGDSSLPLHPDLPITAADVDAAVQDEMAVQVQDVLARRTRCLFLNARATVEVAPQVAQQMARLTGATAEWIDQQLEDVRRLATKYQI